MGGVPVSSVAEFFAALDTDAPGEPVALSVAHKDELQIAAVTLGRRPKDGNPFARLAEVNPGTSDAPSQYPLVPQLPGFSFPNARQWSIWIGSSVLDSAAVVVKPKPPAPFLETGALICA